MTTTTSRAGRDRVRVAFVVQRYGEEICGGAEQHCRLVAEHLAPFVEVDVLTTTALNHLPWDNHYPSGESVVNGVRVRRFPLDQVRDHRAFDQLSYRVFGGSHFADDGEGGKRFLADSGEFVCVLNNPIAMLDQGRVVLSGDAAELLGDDRMAKLYLGAKH